jgi:hypothetical protein
MIEEGDQFGVIDMVPIQQKGSKFVFKDNSDKMQKRCFTV